MLFENWLSLLFVKQSCELKTKQSNMKLSVLVNHLAYQNHTSVIV